VRVFEVLDLAVAYVRQAWLATLILDRIMQQGGNRHVLRAVVFQHRRGDREQMRDIGNRCPFAHLASVNVGGVEQCPIKTVSQDGSVCHVFDSRISG
jgi:hypothetical protein